MNWKLLITPWLVLAQLCLGPTSVLCICRGDDGNCRVEWSGFEACRCEQSPAIRSELSPLPAARGDETNSVSKPKCRCRNHAGEKLAAHSENGPPCQVGPHERHDVSLTESTAQGLARIRSSSEPCRCQHTPLSRVPATAATGSISARCRDGMGPTDALPCSALFEGWGADFAASAGWRFRAQHCFAPARGSLAHTVLRC